MRSHFVKKKCFRKNLSILIGYFRIGPRFVVCTKILIFCMYYTRILSHFSLRLHNDQGVKTIIIVTFITRCPLACVI